MHIYISYVCKAKLHNMNSYFIQSSKELLYIKINGIWTTRYMDLGLYIGGRSI